MVSHEQILAAPSKWAGILISRSLPLGGGIIGELDVQDLERKLKQLGTTQRWV